MDGNEFRQQEARTLTYRKLKKRRDELQEAIDQIMNREDDPFTGNTRESRRINSLHIGFSETLVKSPPVEMMITDLGISARLFGQALLVLLREKLEKIQNEMESI